MADTWEPCFKQHGMLQTAWPLVTEEKLCTAVHSFTQSLCHNTTTAWLLTTQYSTLISSFITVFIITWSYLGSQQQLWHKSKLALKQSTVLESLTTVRWDQEWLSVSADQPGRDAQVAWARRRALSVSHHCSSGMTCLAKDATDMIYPPGAQNTNAGVKHQTHLCSQLNPS